MLAAWLGDLIRRRVRPRADDSKNGEFGTILPATLTLLGLVIACTLAMAVSRYDQRKNLEESEANAIGTEYVRTDFLPASQAAEVRSLLKQYLQQRILFYQVRDPVRLRQVAAETAALQDRLWFTVAGSAATHPTPVVALVVAGMNDVLNSQGYTQAAWWNRIPPEAWLLMILLAIACNLLLGYSEAHAARSTMLVLPLLVAFAFFLIADIDSPNGGIVRISAQNLIAQYRQMR